MPSNRPGSRGNAVRRTLFASWPGGVFVSLLLLSTGCATRPEQAPSWSSVTVRQTPVPVIVEHTAADLPAVAAVAAAVEQALPLLGRWGQLQAPVTIRVHPDHEALERAIGRRGYAWLRAWARYDRIDLQSPASCGVLGARAGQLEELLAHELTHCLMYQRIAGPEDWTQRQVPLWFREGMASVVSVQGYRRPTGQQLAAFLRTHPREDVVEDGESLQQHQSELVYGAAHLAFESLVTRHGQQGIGTLLDAMRAGASFDDAFAAMTQGSSPTAFLRQFRVGLETAGRLAPATPPLRPGLQAAPGR